MAPTITALASGTSTVNDTTVTVTGVTASAGDLLILAVAANNSGASGVAAAITSISDGTDNLYRVRGSAWNVTSGAANDGATLQWLEARLVASLSSATITITFTAANAAKAVQVWRVQPSATEHLEFFEAGTGLGATARTSHAANTVTSAASGVYIFGGAAIETNTAVTGDSDTSNGTWSTAASACADTGSDLTSMTVSGQWKLTTGSGNQDWACSTGAAKDSVASTLTYTVVSLGVAFVRGGTNGVSTTSNTTLTISEVTAPVGSVLVVMIAAGNAGTLGAAASITSISDGTSNTYTQRGSTGNVDPAAAADGASQFFYECTVANALSNATITVTFGENNPEKVIQVYILMAGSGYKPEFVSVQTASGGSTRTSHSASTVSVTSGDLIFAMAAIETDDAITGDSDTTNGSWAAIRTGLADAGVDASAMSCSSQYKFATGTGNQDWACTTATGRDSVSNTIIYRANIVAASMLPVPNIPPFQHMMMR